MCEPSKADAPGLSAADTASRRARSATVFDRPLHRARSAAVTGPWLVA